MTAAIRMAAAQVRGPLYRSAHAVTRPVAPKLRRAVVLWAASDEPTTTPELLVNTFTDEQKQSLWNGTYTMIKELKALDTPRDELLMYFALSEKAPDAYPGFDITRVSTIATPLLSASGLPLHEVEDFEALGVMKKMLEEFWSWRRRGGGMYAVQDGMKIHECALEELQRLTIEDIEAEASRISSSLLDGLDMSEEDKTAMAGSLTNLAVGGVQSMLWSSLVGGVLLVLFIFFAASSGPR